MGWDVAGERGRRVALRRAMAAGLAALLAMWMVPAGAAWAEPTRSLAQESAASANLAAETEALLQGADVHNVGTFAELQGVVDQMNTARGGRHVVYLTANLAAAPGEANPFPRYVLNYGELIIVGQGHEIDFSFRKNDATIDTGIEIATLDSSVPPVLYLGLPDGSGGSLTITGPTCDSLYDRHGVMLFSRTLVRARDERAVLKMNPGTVLDGGGAGALACGGSGVASGEGNSFRGVVFQNAELALWSDGGLVDNCTVKDIVSPNDALARDKVFSGIMYFELTDGAAKPDSSLMLSNTEVYNCNIHPAANTGGNGVHITGSGSCVLDNVQFHDNILGGDQGDLETAAMVHYSGRIAAEPASTTPYLEIRNCQFSENRGIGYGGIISAAQFSSFGELEAADVKISDCTFTRNQVEVSDLATMFQLPSSTVALGGLASAEVSGCVFDGNQGSRISGGLYVGGVPRFTVEDCVFRGNESDAGGALEVTNTATISLPDAVPTYVATEGSIVNCTFDANHAKGSLDPSVSGGGALYIHQGAQVTMTGGKVTNNTAQYHGGGVWLSNGARLTMENVELSGNTTPAHGGGVSIPYKTAADEPDAELVMTGCTVSGNAAGEFGGGVQAMSGQVELVDCAVVGNVAGSEDPSAGDAALVEGSHGGGVWAESGLGHVADAAYVESPAAITVTGGTVADNRAGDHAGGAGASQGAILEMEGVAITGNHAGDHGGGALSEGGDSAGRPSQVTLVDCAVEHNEAGNHGGGVGAAAMAAVAHSRDGEQAAATADAAAVAGHMTVAGGRVWGNTTSGAGGGACAEPGSYLDLSQTKVYGNAAATAADGVGVHSGATVLLGSVADEAELPCGHAVDGWYYDAAGARWAALIEQDPPVAYPLVVAEGVAFDPATGVWTITAGDHALKDAHGVEPHLPGVVPPSAQGPESTGEAVAPSPVAPGRLSPLPATGDESPAVAAAVAGALAALAVAGVSGWRLRRWR